MGRQGMHNIFVGKPLGKCPVVRPRTKQNDNIKIDLSDGL